MGNFVNVCLDSRGAALHSLWFVRSTEDGGSCTRFEQSLVGISRGRSWTVVRPTLGSKVWGGTAGL